MGGDRSAEGKLKSIITEDKLQIEYKGLERIEVDNRLGIIAASNEDWPVPVGMGDRRWACFECNNQYAHKGGDEGGEPAAYFTALYSQMKNGGQAAMLFDLLRRKVSASDIRGRVPNTAEKARLKARALRSPEQWLYELLQEGEILACAEFPAPQPWETPVEKADLYQAYEEYCTSHRKHLEPLNIWGRKLSKVLGDAINLECRTRVNGKTVGRRVKFDPLELCRERFDRAIGNIPNGEHWAPLPTEEQQPPVVELHLVRSEEDLDVASGE